MRHFLFNKFCITHRYFLSLPFLELFSLAEKQQIYFLSLPFLELFSLAEKQQIATL